MRWLSLMTALMLFGSLAQAGSQDEIDRIMAMKAMPDGVVFEIVTGSDGLEWAIPQIVDYSEQLRSRFADISIAVVSHGREQFALQKTNTQEYAEVHHKVQSLVRDSNIPVHVCGTHASWRGLGEEDFPDYVDVAPTGPAQINDYVSLGYILIELEQD